MRWAPLIEDDGLVGWDRHDEADGRVRGGAGGAPGTDSGGGVSKSATKALRAGIGRGGKRGISTILLARSGAIGVFATDLDKQRRRGLGRRPRQVPRRALRTRKCSSNRRSRVQNAPLESEMHISTSKGPATASRAPVAPAPPRSIFGDPTRRGAAILISSEAVARRSGSARSWAGADPSPACAMRAQRNEIRLGSHHASSARQNPPALNPREPAAHNAIPGDITKTTPPGAGEGRVFPGGRRGPHAPWEGVRSSAPWLPVPCVRTGSQPRRGATVDVAPPRER